MLCLKKYNLSILTVKLNGDGKKNLCHRYSEKLEQNTFFTIIFDELSLLMCFLLLISVIKADRRF